MALDLDSQKMKNSKSCPILVFRNHVYSKKYIAKHLLYYFTKFYLLFSFWFVLYQILDIFLRSILRLSLRQACVLKLSKIKVNIIENVCEKECLKSMISNFVVGILFLAFVIFLNSETSCIGVVSAWIDST